MDYKEKYEMALETIQEILDSGSDSIKMSRLRLRLQSVFPEIRESEDERVRKGLINYFNHHKNGINIFYGIKGDDILAWLEKQGEQKPIIEMKSAEESLGIDSNIYNEIVDKCIYGEQKSQRMISAEAKEAMYAKTAWSEEEQDNFKHLMDEIVCLGNRRNSANRSYYDRLINFLDELKDRAQPREEWCEKDERKLDRLIAYFEKRVAFTDNDYPEYVSWLKSLKPQNRWKPSDEQMKVLISEVEGWTKGCPKQKVLESLYNDLKKLRKE